MPENIDSFSKRMKADYVQTGGRYLFRNGAQSNGTDHIEPPDNPRLLINLQIEFLNAKLQEEEAAYEAATTPKREHEGDFSDRQGCPRITHGGRWLYANGAQWTSQGGIEPPHEPEEKLRLKIEYLGAMLEREERLFNQCQTYINTQATYHSYGAGPAPAEEAFTDLERFQKNVLKLRQQLRAKERKLIDLHGQSPEQLYLEKRGLERSIAQQAISRASGFQI